MPLTDHPLHPFLKPASVAIVGVSPNWSYVHTILQQLIALGMPERIYPVNPNYPEVAGLPAYPRLTDIPESVDLVLVAVPRRLVPDVLAQAEAKGVRGVNIITSGFEELGGEEGARHHRLLIDFVARTGARIVGPNCYGNFSAVHRFAGMPNMLRAMAPGRVGLAFQSGGMAIYCVTALADRHIGLTHGVTTGNEADLDVAAALEYFAADEATGVVACFVEQIREPERFLAAAARCADLRKPVVVLKVGRSDAGRVSAQAHTGSLAGADRVVDAALAQVGVARVNSLEELVETVAILHARRLPRGRGVGALTVSGGANGALLDLAADLGLEFPPFAPASRRVIREALYDYVATTNPLDITGPGIYADTPIHVAALDALGGDPNMHVILHAPVGGNGALDAQGEVGKALLAAARKYPEKVWVRLATVAGTFRDQPPGGPPPAEPFTELEGVPFLQGFENGLRAVAALIRYAEFQARWQQARAAAPPAPSAADAARRERALALLRAAGPAGPTEAEGKELLALYGIPTTRERPAATAEEAVAAARAIGYPVALKIVSPQIRHKTEAGGVRLGLADDVAVAAAFAEVVANARRHDPDAEIRGVTVQELVAGGQELLLGMANDPQLGPAVVVGLGGIYVEILRDSALRLPPLAPADARAMLESLRGYPLLRGARGLPPLDVDAAVAALRAFAQLALDLRDEVAAIDVNPLIVLPAGQGVRAVDCLVVRRDAAAPGADG
ncbi:MAG TPA: acetate--CoA ligase family protein [Thermomicrobiales bacterium]|nr:acetate--CoA ligase family protein [Thermomicrobiales bacterium]